MFIFLSLLTAASALSHGFTLEPQVSDYPPKALQEKRQGAVTVRIRNSEVKTCEISKKTRSSDLDSATCPLIMQHINVLTLDSAKTSIVVNVRWSIPNDVVMSDYDGAIPFNQSAWVQPSDIPYAYYAKIGDILQAEIRFDVATDGTVGRCEVTASSGNPSLDTRLCALISKRATFLPAVATDGAARIAHAKTIVRWYAKP